MRIVVVARMRDEEELLPWFLANMTHADEIHLADDGSNPEFQVKAIELAFQHGNTNVYARNQKHQPFFEEYEHFKFALAQVEGKRFDWLHYADLDEIPTVAFQKGIREYLGTIEKTTERLGVEVPFPYLCPGWKEYYTEVSQWPICRIFNHIPGVINSEYVQLMVPPKRLQAPSYMAITHWNWALKKRFDYKRKQYEIRFRQPSWHPSEKYPDRSLLSADTRWYTPEGKDASWVDLSIHFDGGDIDGYSNSFGIYR